MKLNKSSLFIVISIVIVSSIFTIIFNNSRQVVDYIITNFGSYKLSFVAIISVFLTLIIFTVFSGLLFIVIKYIGQGVIKFKNLFLIIAVTSAVQAVLLFVNALSVNSNILSLVIRVLCVMAIYFAIPKFITSVKNKKVLQITIIIFLILYVIFT